MPQHAEQMQRIDVNGIGGERRAVIALGVVQPAVAMCGVSADKNGFHN
jgi:hypothetical protein